MGVDIAGPFYNGRYVLAAVDYASGWPELVTKRTIASRDVIEWMDELFARYGLPQAVVTDNGPQFVSRELEEYLKERDVHHYTTAVYNPQENGLVERFNRTLKTTIQAAVALGTNWDKALREFLLSYRATPREGGESPAKIFIGREIRMKFQPNPSEPMRVDKERNMRARFQVGDRVGKNPPSGQRDADLQRTENHPGGAGTVHLPSVRWEEMEQPEDLCVARGKEPPCLRTLTFWRETRT